jgi:hypothetical protein
MLKNINGGGLLAMTATVNILTVAVIVKRPPPLMVGYI